MCILKKKKRYVCTRKVTKFIIEMPIDIKKKVKEKPDVFILLFRFLFLEKSEQGGDVLFSTWQVYCMDYMQIQR